MSKEIEVLLIKDVKGLGKFGQSKRVRLGFARNYLLPYEHAILASGATATRFAALKKREEKRSAHEREASLKLQASLEGKTLTLSAKAQKSGVLYGSITKKEIVAAIKENLATPISVSQLDIEDHLKEVGTYPFKVLFPQDISASLTLTVVGLD